MNELINDNKDISNDEARDMTTAKNKRLAAMDTELDFEDMSPESVERVTRKVQSKLMFPQATDPMLAAFKEELKFAVTKKDKKARKKEAAAAKEAPGLLGPLRSLAGELRRDRDGGGDAAGTPTTHRSPRFVLKRHFAWGRE